ncbi:MAG: hypothetical protein HZC42_01275 [Candidatus Eisenbacteria bacterium]|nr:hypothetical protein [Candidatus Eisenbacteria bacterium]
MSAELDHLWTLHGLDEAALAIRAALARFPGQRADLERRVAAERARLEALKHRLAELQKERRVLEQEISGLTEQERKFQSQLPLIKKNEEYQALLHEIAGVKQKRSDLETEVLVRLEAEERQLAERPLAERGLQAAEREAAAQRERIAAEEASEQAKAAAIEARREVQIAGLGAAVRARYERVHGSRDGRAVVAILKGACGGCFRGQPPHVLQEARRRDRVLSCEGCGRLIVWPPDEG